MNGKTTLIKGFQSSKTGNAFDAAVKFDAKQCLSSHKTKAVAKNNGISKIFTTFASERLYSTIRIVI